MPGTSTFKVATSIRGGNRNWAQRPVNSAVATGAPQPAQVAQPASMGQRSVQSSLAPSTSTTTITLLMPALTAFGSPGSKSEETTASTIRSTDRTESIARCRNCTDMGLGAWWYFIPVVCVY